VRELRKLHRDANRRQKLAPRVSDEEKKWISWKEYLAVVKASASDLEVQLQAFQALTLPLSGGGKMAERARGVAGRRVAVAYQKMLLLSLFAGKFMTEI